MTREERLVLVIHHLSICTSCQDSMHFGYGGPLCPNGERMWAEAQVPPLGQLSPENGPADMSGTQTEFRPGPLVPKELLNG